MPYAIRLPDGTLVENIPDEITPQQAKQRILERRPELMGQVTPPVEEDSGFLRQVADVPLGVAKGAVTGVRMIADAFGANSPVSQTIKGAEDYLAGLMSAESRKDSQEIARIMQDAEDKGMGDQVKAALQAFMTAPVDLLAQGLGTAAPVVLSTLGAKVLGAGALATKGIGLGLGAGMGAGVTKGTIYEETKKALQETGMPEEQAEARAQLAQSYGGENLDMILAGTALGGLASTTGIEKALTGPLARGILARAGVQEGAEQAVQQGLARRVATGALTEAVPEVLQAGQEQLAANIALQREGFDVDTMRGVVGAAALEGLVGAGLGAGVGAIPSGTTAQQPPPPPREEPLPETPEAPIPPVAAPEVETFPAERAFTAEDIDAAGVDFPRGFLPFVRRNILGKTRSQLQAEVEDNPELIEGEAPSARLIRSLLQPQPAADQSGVGLPVQQPAGAPTGIGAPQPGAVDGAGGIAQPPVVPQAPVTPTVTETPRGITTPQAEQTEAKRPQVTPGEVILQNRNRSTPASIAQMQDIAAKPDYGRMGFSRDFANGAPVVFGGSIPEAQLGVEETAIATDGQRIPVRYAVMNANEVLASNRADGGVNQEYATATDRTRAIAGNGRIAGIQAAHQRGTTGDYVRDLKADARLHGIDPGVIDSVQNPVLVRIMPEQFVTPDIGDVSNIATGLELSPTEKARNDQRRVDLGALQFAEDGSITPNTVIQFVRGMPKTEQGGLINPDGRPSSQAYDRLRNAIFARAYNDDQLIELYAQTEDADARNVLSALAQVAGKMARLEGAGDFDIRNIVTDAAKIAVNARRNGIAISRVAQQADIAADPDVQAILDMLAANSRSVPKMAGPLGTLADRSYEEFTKPAEDFFGEVPKRTREELVGQLRTENEQARQQALEEQDRRRATQEDDVRQAPEPTGAQVATATPGEELTLTPPSAEAQAESERRAQEAAKAEEEAAKEAERAAEAERKERERREIKQRSAGAAGDFQLGQTAEQNLTGQKDIFDTPVQISPEQEKRDALNKLESALFVVVPPFRAVYANRSARLTPRQLTKKQVNEITKLAADAIDLGMPASLIASITAGGATSTESIAGVTTENRFFLLGKQWASQTPAEKLHAIVHEFGHVADSSLGRVSGKSDWKKAHDELKGWYDSSTTPGKHPLGYPFAAQFRGKVRLESESYAQAFAMYFTNPVDLQTNAPAAYSQIQSAIERIQNESQATSRTGAAAPSGTTQQVQPARAEKGPTVQPRAREVGTGVGTVERGQDRGAGQVTEKSVGGPSMAYHAGDLQYGRDTTLGRMMGGRSTGHFGTGVYFVSEPSLISGRQGRPVQAVDLSEYNLARPSSPESAKRLHDALRTVNRMEDAADVDTRDGSTAIANMQSVLGLSSQNEIRSAMKEAVAEAAELRPTYAFESDYIDSASTRLMKKLGYDGVDTRGLKGFDNTEFGTVVYAKQIVPDLRGDQQEINQMVSVAVDQVGTENFQRWSRNAPLVMADMALKYDFKTGQPFVAQSFHGTNAVEDFAAFDLEKGGDQTAAESASMGIFSTSSPEVAGDYAGNIGFGRYLGLAVKGVPELKDDPEANRLQNEVEAAKKASTKAYNDALDNAVEYLGKFAIPDDPELNRKLAQNLMEILPGAEERQAKIEAANQKMFAAERKLSEYIFDYEASKIPQRIMPLFVRMSNPKVYDAEGKTPAEFPLSDRIAQAKREGHDGVVFKNIADPAPVAVHYVAFEPNQLKSATGNIGTYGDTQELNFMMSPVEDPDAVKGEEAKDAVRASRESILYKPVDATWDNVADPKEFKLSDTFFYNWVDKQVDLRRVVDAIKATGRRVDYKWNALEKERTYHGRVAKRTKDYLTNELEPTVELMTKYGISQREIGEYLLNRHAPEANAQIAMRNPAFPDGGSSIDTADAIAYMNNLDPARKKQLDEVAKRMDKTLERMQDYLVESGLEKAETIQGWRDMFQFYIPLAREDGDFSVNKAMSQGSGYSQSGSVSKSRTGSTKEINLDQIFSTIAMQHEQMIVKAERNRVGNASFGLALQNPNPKFWLALDPETNVVWKQLKKVAALREDKKLLDEIIESGNLTPSQREMYKMEIDLINRLIRKELQPARSAYAKARDDLVELGFKPEEANQMVEQIMMPPMTARYDKAKNEVVYTASSAINNPFVFATRVNGSDKYILFNGNDERAARMATAMKNMDAADLGEALSKVATITRYFAAINTQYNPVFGAYNFLRDMQTAALQISTTEIADERSKVLSGAMPAMKALWQQARGERSKNKKDSEWARDIEEFENEGGQTGFRDLFSQKEERAAAIQRMIDPSSWADSGMGKFFTAGGKLKVPFEVARKGLAPLFDVLTDYNKALENAVRLSAYKVARDKFIKQGMEPAAAKQKAAVIAKDITVNFNQKGAQATQMGALFAFFNASVQGTYMMAKTLAGPLGKTIIGGGLLFGAIQAVMLAAAGFDDEEPPEFVKQRNYIIPYGDGKYFAFPMPLGFNVIPSISRIATEWILSGGENGTKKALDLLDVIMDMYNPIGNAGLSLQTIMPTVLDPIAALAENKDWTGKQIAREDFSGLNPTPGFTRSRDSSSVISQELSRYLNYLSGGTDAAKGAISPTADQIDYLIGQLTGGVGREALKLAKTVETQVTGEELPTYSIPLIGRFFGNVNENAAVASAFYRNLTELNVHKAELDDIREKKGNVQEYLRENPEARLVQSAQAQYRNIQNLKKLRRELLARDEKERAKKVEERINQQMKRLNERYREMAG